MKLKTSLIFVLLCVAYLVYSFVLYARPEKAMKDTAIAKASAGKLVWQKYNCQACHQLYGLGGYLGPDLTNVMSKYYNNRAIVKSFIISGNASMPAYQMSAEDYESLVDYLAWMNQTGKASPKSFKNIGGGMIE